MSPRRLFLLAAILIAGLQARGPAVAEESESLLPPPASKEECEQVPHPLGSRVRCLRAREATLLFGRILKASALPAPQLKLRFRLNGAVNGWYRLDSQTVVIDGGYLSKADGGTLAVVSHELGHWVQHQEGLLGGRYTPQQIEAHADWLGSRLAARAGFQPSVWLNARKIAWGCDAAADPALSMSHPSTRDRWSNMMSREPSLSRHVRRDDRHPNPLPFRSGDSPGAFDANGKDARRAAVSGAQARKRCVQLKEQLTGGRLVAEEPDGAARPAGAETPGLEAETMDAEIGVPDCLSQ